MRLNLKYHFGIASLLLLLTSCNSRALYATSVPTQNTVSQIMLTDTAVTHKNLMTTPTLLPSETEALAPTAEAISSVQVDDLHVAYIMDGNLYVQDSGKQPVQLTKSGKDHTPSFTKDGKKIIFYRGTWDKPNEIYIINVDGTQEHTLVTARLLMEIDPIYTIRTELGSYSFIIPIKPLPMAVSRRKRFNRER